MYFIFCFSPFSFVGDGQPCPYGQTGTSLSTCRGEHFNDSVRKKTASVFFLLNHFQPVDRKNNLGIAGFNPTSEFTCDIHNRGPGVSK